MWSMVAGSTPMIRLHTESKASRRSVALGVVVLFAFGLSVPAIVLAFNGDHKARVAVGGVTLTPGEQEGRELFAKSCGVCHTLAATKSVGEIGPNLDTRVGADISTPAGRTCRMSIPACAAPWSMA